MTCKLKLSKFSEVRYWGWSCPKCECWNEEDINPNHFDEYDEELGEYFECIGCYELFDLDKGEKNEKLL